MARKEKQKLDQLRDLLEQRLLPCPPGLPQSEEEEQAFLINLVRLKCMRMTNRECAIKMGVSVGTIKDYLAGEAYQEMRDRLIADTRDRGHMRISEILDDATRVLHELMLNAKSEFVRLKAVELAIEAGGLRQPKEEAKGDSRDSVAQFLKEVEAKRQVNLAATVVAAEQNGVVESLPVLPPGVSPELRRYQEHVGPGGTLPSSFRTGRDDRKRQQGNESK